MEKKYTTDEVNVIWKPDLCIHSGKCVGALPNVFKPKEKPWIQLEGANSEAVKKAVLNCPSGALSLGGVRSEEPDSGKTVAISFIDNGPMIVTGSVDLAYGDDVKKPSGPRTAFCRCGASANKPFCDGSHRQSGFSD